MKIAYGALFVLLVGCARLDTKASGGPCDIEPISTATAGQRCVFIEIAKRCNAVDECLVHCWNDGRGRGVGGGCHHLCWGDMSLEWTPPESVTSCPAE
jgi:hypothetical protein